MSKPVKVVRETGVGNRSCGVNPDSEMNSLKERLEAHESKYYEIKAEFEALKSLNEELSLRHDKEIKELKLDLRIAKRDADKWQDHNRYLRDEKKELKDQINAIQSNNNDLKQQMGAKDQQIEQLIQQIKTINDEFTSKLTDQKAIKESFEERIKCLNTETKALREQLSKQFDWKRKFDDSDKKSKQLSKELEVLRNQMQSIQSELISKSKDIENKEKEINKLKKNNKILQDQCLQMDRQAEQFKSKYQGLGAQKVKWIEEKGSTLTEVQKLTQELESVKDNLNTALKEREDVLKVLESERKQNHNMVSLDRQRFNDLEQTLKEVLQKNHEYEDKLRQHEQHFYAKDELVVSLDTKISDYEEELIAIKEEAAHHITTIGELKDSNHKLSKTLEKSFEKIEELQTRIDSLHHQIEIKDDEMNRERIASQETIGQQLKLIDFLQNKTEALEKQKKPFISITPTKKVVNNSSRPIYAEELKDLDRLLAEERTKSRRLVEENNKLKTALKKDSNYRAEEEISIKSDLSPTNQLFRKPLFSDNKKKVKKRIENQLQTQSSYEQNCDQPSSRMRHNIPHRFAVITNKIPNNKCISCAEVIHFGKKAKKCGECNATVHPKCDQRLPNNCGLPVQLMQQLFHSSHNVNQNYDDYYQSQPVDDVIEVETLEPSAPEETFTKYDYNSDSSATTDNNESDSGAVISSALIDNPYQLKEIQDICDNKENDGFSFTDSLLEMIERADNISGNPLN